MYIFIIPPMHVVLELNGRITPEEIENLEYDKESNEIRFTVDSKPYSVCVTKHTGTYIIRIDDDEILCGHKAALKKRIFNR